MIPIVITEQVENRSLSFLFLPRRKEWNGSELDQEEVMESLEE